MEDLRTPGHDATSSNSLHSWSDASRDDPLNDGGETLYDRSTSTAIYISMVHESEVHALDVVHLEISCRICSSTKTFAACVDAPDQPPHFRSEQTNTL